MRVTGLGLVVVRAVAKKTKADWTPASKKRGADS